MVEFFPTLDEIKTLHPQPTKGEWALLNFLNDYLEKFPYEPFEVYYQPPWDGSFPDVVIMRKNHGILIIEVKDWNLDLYEIENNYTWICKKPKRGINSEQRVKSPIAQATYYKNLFYDTYSRTLAEKNLSDKNIYSLVESAVFFYGSSEEKLKKFFIGKFEKIFNTLTSNEITLLTLDMLESNGLKNTRYANFLLNRQTKFFDEKIYNELHRVLKPSEHSKLKAFPKILNDRQKELATSKKGSYKVRGPAGCGKTTVLAYRAVSAFQRTQKPVLILTFNITLCNYIHDCVSEAVNNLPNIARRKGWIMKHFVIKHVHHFLSNYQNKHNQEDKFIITKNGKKTKSYELEDTPQKYSTILVDEVQDYERSWMETIVYKLLDEGGEIVFFGDKDQDLYERREFEHIPGLPGRWNELKGTYRLRGKIADLARAFQIKFFNGSQGNEIKTIKNSQIELMLANETVEYYFMNTFDIQPVIKIFNENLSSNDDICIMSQIISNVRPIDKKLRDMNYPTITTFETEEEYQQIITNFPLPDYATPRIILEIRNKIRHGENLTDEEKEITDILFKRDSELNSIRRVHKFNFWMESGKIKLSTIHSYKGWGINTEILILGGNASSFEADEEKFLNDEMVYTGITRAIKNLIIINIGDEVYDKFFSDWIKNN